MILRHKETFEARQLSAKTRAEICQWIGPERAWFYESNGDSEMYLYPTHNNGNALGGMPIPEGAWVLKGSMGTVIAKHDLEDFEEVK